MNRAGKMLSTKIYMQEMSKTFFSSKNKKITKKVKCFFLIMFISNLKAVGITMLKKIFYFFITIFFLIGKI